MESSVEKRRGMDAAGGFTVTTQLDLLKRDWCETATPIVLRMMRGMQFTTDDVHGYVNPPEHPNWFGVLMARMKNKHLIERIGYQPSTRPEANGRPIAIWRVI